MGIFGLFGSKEPSENKEEKRVPWKRLTTLDQLDTIVEDSRSKPIAVFKHSTRCGISSMVYRQFERTYDIPEDQMDLYYLDLLSFRNISDEVASRFQVWHQSPQLLVIRNGVAVFDASHHNIGAAQLQRFL